MKLSSVNVHAKNAMDLPEVRWSFKIATVEVNSEKFAVRMMHAEPAIISMRAGKSNLQMNFSFRKIIERIT